MIETIAIEHDHPRKQLHNGRELLTVIAFFDFAFPLTANRQHLAVQVPTSSPC